MTDKFAFAWSLIWLMTFAAASIVGITFRLPLPHSTIACFSIGAMAGAIIVGPIAYVTIRRS